MHEQIVQCAWVLDDNRAGARERDAEICPGLSRIAQILDDLSHSSIRLLTVEVATIESRFDGSLRVFLHASGQNRNVNGINTSLMTLHYIIPQSEAHGSSTAERH
jgi:hypothetical protein